MARVMIVDDDADIRHSVGRLLEEDGHEVLREAHGKDALRHFAGEPVDLDGLRGRVGAPVQLGRGLSKKHSGLSGKRAQFGPPFV